LLQQHGAVLVKRTITRTYFNHSYTGSSVDFQLFDELIGDDYRAAKLAYNRIFLGPTTSVDK
jgi:hypothetical protein